MEQARRPYWRTLYFWVLVAIALGVLVGWLTPETGRALKPLGDGFIKLVKMIITPVIFLTVVTGIAGMSDLKAFGRIGAQGHGLFPDLLDPGAGGRARRRQHRPAGRGAQRRSGDARCRRGRELSQPGARPDDHRLPAQHHSRHDVQRLHRGRDIAGADGVDPVRDRAGDDRRARRAPARRPPGAHRRRLPDGPYPDVRRAARRVRRDGLHHRPIWHRHPRQPRRPDRDLLPHRAPVRVRRSRPGRARGRLLAARAHPLHQGRAAARARNLILGKRDAAADGEARARRLPQADRRPGRADRLFVQPRRHQHLHVAWPPCSSPRRPISSSAWPTSCC